MHKVKPSEDSIWSGVYERFDDVPASASVFDTSAWTDKQKKSVEGLTVALTDRKAIPEAAKSRDYPLPVAAAAVLAGKDRLRIIDYGGAMGQTYLDLLAKIPDSDTRIDCVVIEKKPVTENLSGCLRKFPRLKFMAEENISAAGKSADIVHLGSTLQYIDDWRKLLTDLATQFQPDLFVLSDLLVGDMPSFVTAQNYYGQTIPARFINVREFLDFWAEKMPYKLVYRSLYQPLSGDDYFSQSGLPETHRIKKPCNLVFAKI